MAITLFASGTQSATVTTEHVLSAPNVAGKFVVVVDLANLVAGDVVELRAKQMVLTGGTTRGVDVQQYAGAQPTDRLVARSPEIYNTLTDTNAVQFTLKQTYGTTRNFPWAVYKTEVEDIAGIFATALTEAYAADTVAPTLQQALWMVMSRLGVFGRAISGATETSYKLDKATAAMTHTLDSATTPTSTVRST